MITGKEYERVVGWEGSNAVSPPCDGAAWILRNSIMILEGLRTLQVSLLILKCKNTFCIHLFSQSSIVKPDLAISSYKPGTTNKTTSLLEIHDCTGHVMCHLNAVN